MGIFKDKKKKVDGSVSTTAPVETESQAEVEYVEQLSNPKQVVPEPVVQSQQTIVPTVSEPIQYREVPICMSQSQINNLIIENNIILKQIISSMDN